MSTYSNPLGLPELQQRVDDLKRAYLSGTLSVRFSDGQQKVFQNSKEMLTAIETGEDWIRELQGQRGVRAGFAQHKRGDGPSGPSGLWDGRW